ncbi:MAG: glycosyltransferase family 2 protein [Bacteroidota bacterium]|nr:glycosyltransferase family 2 protein [Bacteroidota bacterium]
MLLVEIFFWVLLLLLWYAYIGYGMVMMLYQRLRKKRYHFSVATDSFPVTIIIPAFNEAQVIEEKINNVFAFDYPSHLMEVMVVTDGSTDNTLNLLKKYPSVKVIHDGNRKGKAAAINSAMRAVTTPFVVITDANTMADAQALHYMMRHFINAEVGAVASEKKIVMKQNDSGIAATGESLYWQYESFMKKTESEVNSTIAVAGELFSMRTSLFNSLDEQIILDDFFISVNILRQGFRVIYEPEALAVEKASVSLAEEAKRKIRIGAGAAQALQYLGCFPYRSLFLNMQYVARRVIRWIIGPIALPLLLWLNSVLVMRPFHSSFYLYIFALQLFFYWLAVAGFFLNRLHGIPRILIAPFYFLFMNACMFIGFIRYFRGMQPVLWEKSLREL